MQFIAITNDEFLALTEQTASEIILNLGLPIGEYVFITPDGDQRAVATTLGGS